MKKIVLTIVLITILGCSKSFDNQLDGLDDDGRETFVRITYPTNMYYTSSQKVIIRGEAGDKAGLKRVEVCINNGDFTKAEGTLSWTIELELSPGENTIFAKAINSKDKAINSELFYIFYLWDKVATLPQPLSHTGVYYDNGNFYLFGGNNFYLQTFPLAQHKIIQYDKETYAINHTHQLNRAFGMPQIGKYNGNFYVVGGLFFENGEASSWDSVDIYNSSGEFVATSPLPVQYARGGGAYVQVGNELYIIGGYNSSGNKTNTIIKCQFTASTCDTWSEVHILPGNLAESGAVFYNDKIYVFGGKTDTGYSKDLIIFDDDYIDYFTGKLKIERTGMGVVRINDKVYILGGENSQGYRDEIEEFDFLSNNSRYLDPMPFKLSYMGVGTDGVKIYLFGIKDSSMINQDIYEYDPSGN